MKLETREKVMQAVHALGYRLNDAARSLKTRRSRSIGFIVPEFNNEFLMEIAQGIEGKLKERGYHLIVSSSNGNPEEEREALQLLQEKAAEGVIIVPSGKRGRHLKTVMDGTIPIITVDREYTDLSIPSVLADNHSGTAEAVEKLFHTPPYGGPIAFIGGEPSITTAEERYRGFLEGVRALRGASPPPSINSSGKRRGDFPIILDTFDTSGGRRALQQLLAEHGLVKKIFVANYFMHLGVTEQLIEEGVDPKDITIAAFDYTPMYSLLQYCRLYVSQPHLEMGNRAVELLLELIEPNQGSRETQNPAEQHPPPGVLRLPTSLKIIEASIR